MANLIDNDQRLIYKSAIDDIADTFGRDITVWKSSSQIINSVEDDYDSFSDKGVKNVTYLPEFKTFKARVKYIDRQEKEFGLAIANTSVDVTQEFQLVRIKVNIEANNYIRDCERITIDGINFTFLTVPRPHGLFEPDYFTIYLRSRP